MELRSPTLSVPQEHINAVSKCDNWRLSPYDEESVQPAYDLIHDPENAKYPKEYWAPRATLDEVDAEVYKMQILTNRTMLPYRIMVANEMVGVIALFRYDLKQTAHLGYYLSHRHQGKGLVTASSRLLIKHAKQNIWPSLENVILRIAPENKPSERVAVHLGAVATGRSEYVRMHEQLDPLLVRVWNLSVANVKDIPMQMEYVPGRQHF